LGQHRSTQRKARCGLLDEARLTEDITTLAEEFKRYALPSRQLRGNLPREGV
jgi:putative transposase